MARPHLYVGQILKWADAHFKRTGKWPTQTSGRIVLLDEKWGNIDSALRMGMRGLPGNWSLAQLLTAHRGKRNKARLPPLRIEQILEWADDYHQAHGRWPHQQSGKVGKTGETWSGINAALRVGLRGLPGGSSVAELLSQQRGTRNHMRLPRLSETQILKWADAHHQRTGKWPRRTSGAIPDTDGQTWMGIDGALWNGSRGLKRVTSLSQLLFERRGVEPAGQPRLTVGRIRAWAMAYFERTGRWPTPKSGEIPGTGGETWRRIDNALLTGRRGLSVYLTLTELLTGRGWKVRRTPITEQQILGWADEHLARTGKWPTAESGEINEEQGTWANIQDCLNKGLRGLPGNSSLAQLLAKHRGKRNVQRLPRLTIQQILRWCDAHHKQTGKWPNRSAGGIAGTDETWAVIDGALMSGNRGLPGGSSLSRVLHDHRGQRHPKFLQPLSVKLVLEWADEHHRRTGRWPTSSSGPIHGTQDETWTSIQSAIRRGARGLPKGTGLADLLSEHRGVRNRKNAPKLSVALILKWADAFYARHGRWPGQKSGDIPEAPGETWSGVDSALRQQIRGLRITSTLTLLLHRYRNMPMPR